MEVKDMMAAIPIAIPRIVKKLLSFLSFKLLNANNTASLSNSSKLSLLFEFLKRKEEH